MDGGSAVSVGALRHASAMSVWFADQVKAGLEVRDQTINKLHKANRQFRRHALERSAKDAGASRVEHDPMFNHSKRMKLRTASVTRTQRAGDST